jgi:Domain of unknown function (DUF1893).
MSLIYVKDLLTNSDCTFAAMKNGEVYKSSLKGILPVINKLKEDPAYFEGADVADEVIGKAAALLLIYGKVRSIYTPVISEHAMEILEKHHIYFEYDKKVPFILNRNKDGMCPMEKTVLNTDDPVTAYKLLSDKISKP